MTSLTNYLAMAARQHADARAIQCGQRSLSYRELDTASTAVASCLEKNGVRKGDRVAIWRLKSVESLIGIHAVLKCGAVYVPIDPVGPVKRACSIIEDCGAKAMVTSSNLWDELLRSGGGVPFCTTIIGAAGTNDCMNGRRCITWDDALTSSDILVPEAVNEDDPAYILYTSGSTGLPKGVTLSHRNAMSFIEWAVAELDITCSDRLCSHAPFHFDLSIFDIFAAVRAAASLVVIPEHRAGLGPALNQIIKSERITIWYSVPAALTRMLEARNKDELSSPWLRAILFAGEVFPPRYLRQLAMTAPQATLWNLYGPTETNVCTFHRVVPSDIENGSPLPIGQVCPYDKAHILTDEGRFCRPAARITGELCISGSSVMLGYWNDETRTRRSTALADGDGDGAVSVYRTGDFVRVLDNGKLAYVGRRDDMVKIRGYRVELMEIEERLVSLPQVSEAACTTSKGDQGDLSITAHMVVSGARDPRPRTAEGIRGEILTMLPRYMVPSHFRFVDQLPRTSTGKVDRQQLEADDLGSMPRG